MCTTGSFFTSALPPKRDTASMNLGGGGINRSFAVPRFQDKKWGETSCVHSLKPAQSDAWIGVLSSFISQRRQLVLLRQIIEISPRRMRRLGGAAVKHQKQGEDTSARPKTRSGGGESSPDVLEPLHLQRRQSLRSVL